MLSSIKVAEDETVEVGAELALIDDGSGAPAAEQAPQAEQVAEPAPEPAPAAPSTEQAAPAPAPTAEASAGGGAPPRARTWSCPRSASPSPRAPSPAG